MNLLTIKTCSYIGTSRFVTASSLTTFNCREQLLVRGGRSEAVDTKFVASGMKTEPLFLKG